MKLVKICGSRSGRPYFSLPRAMLLIKNAMFLPSVRMLQAFFVFAHVRRRKAVYAVPVLAGGNRHANDGEVFVEFVEGSRAAAAARRYNGSAYFHALIKRSAEKEPVQKAD